MPPSTWAIVVAGGDGRRFGAPKQFVELQGRAVFEWAVAAARSVAEGVVLVVPADGLAGLGAPSGVEELVAGGSTRAASVRAGLAAVPTTAEIVVVHDAARPLASPALFEAVVAAVLGGADGAIPAVPVADTIKRVENDRVVATLERGDLVVVQTPQAFRAEALRAAHAGAPEATDDAALLEAAGAQIVVVAGEARNVKLTRVEDLTVVEALAGLDVGPAARR